MQARTRVRPSLEVLEQRWCPTVTATVNRGFLLVTGEATTAGDAITVTQTAADTFTVEDGGTLVGTLTGVTRDVTIRLGSANDNVVLDLGGNATPRGVTVSLGGGDNTLSVVNGTVSGFFTVLGGRGADGVTLGDGTDDLQFNRNVAVFLDGGDNSLTVADGVTAKGNVEAVGVNDTTLEAGSVFEQNVGIVAGSAGSVVSVDGEIEGSLLFLGSNSVDSVTVTGNVGGGALVSTFGGDDSITLSGTIAGPLFLDAGAGNDTLTMTATARFEGLAVIGMGSGNDTVTLDDAATIARMFINGGFGTDTFVGTRTRAGLTLFSFEA